MVVFLLLVSAERLSSAFLQNILRSGGHPTCPFIFFGAYGRALEKNGCVFSKVDF
jgi:hypothetical protein